MAFTKKGFRWLKRGIVPPESLQENGFTVGTKLPADYLNEQFTATYEAIEELQEKAVEKVEGKGLSTSDYTKEEKEKLESVEPGANKYVAPIATTTGFGDVKVGMNLIAVNGIISVANGTVSTKGVVQLTDSVTSTSTTTAATANAVKMANDAIKNASADTSTLQANFIDLAIEVETSKNAELNGVTANIAIETFLDLSDVMLERGTYDAINKWIEV